MSEELEILKHPIYPIPELEMCRERMGNAEKGRELWEMMIRERNTLIEEEERNRLGLGYEPGIWKVCDALLDLKCYDAAFLERLDGELKMSWDEFCRHIRGMHGFDDPLIVLLALGCNRSGKSEYAAKRTVQIMMDNPKCLAWMFSQSADSSKEVVQPKIWDYLPPDHKVQTRTSGMYVKYSEQNRFAYAKFVLANLAKGQFRNYSQNILTLEGPAPKWVWGDEEIPDDFQTTLEGRLGSSYGKMVDTFTPISGWTSVVNKFLEGSEIVRANTAFLLPKDEGPPDLCRELGYDHEILYEEARKRDDRATIAEDPLDWIKKKASRPAVPAGRAFEKMPRIRRCMAEHKGVVYFHSGDNAFGNPPRTWDIWRGSPRTVIMMRMYGEPTKSQGNQLPKFDRGIHVIPDGMIPAEGTNYMCIDPTPGGRPWFLTWIRMTRHAAYIYRDWPRVASVPGLADVPWGMWAESSGRKGGINDGDPGQGAQPIGWGYQRYAQEIMRVEGWENWRDVDDSILPVIEAARMDPVLPMGEEIEERFMDSRAASAPRQHNDLVTTLMEMMIDYGFDIRETVGNRVDERVQEINNWLDFKVDEKGEIVVPPPLYVAESCTNTIFCAQNWKNVDGGSAAMKDPVDNLGYLLTAGCEWIEESGYKSVGGGYR